MKDQIGPLFLGNLANVLANQSDYSWTVRGTEYDSHDVGTLSDRGVTRFGHVNHHNTLRTPYR
jgi:hypothetical protein